VAGRTAAEATRVRPRGLRFAWEVLARGQVRQAEIASEAVDIMLAEQDIDAQVDALLNSPSFTTSLETFTRMVEQVDIDAEFERLVDSLAQDAARAAQSVATATRPNIAHVRFLNPPSCSRCAVLAGRIYRWSDGFERHPGCDCVMIPTTVANDQLIQDPVELARQGLVTGLSKADRRAILDDGADMGRVVNIRRTSAGLIESGRALRRRGRLTPEAIYRQAGDDREAALALLTSNGYLT
jgi:hypothetical protein